MKNCDECPRCGNGTLEYLATHAHCFECNYSPDLEARKTERPRPSIAKTAIAGVMLVSLAACTTNAPKTDAEQKQENREGTQIKNSERDFPHHHFIHGDVF